MMDQNQVVSELNEKINIRSRILAILGNEMETPSRCSKNVIEGVTVYGMFLYQIASQISDRCTTDIVARRCKSMGLVVSRVAGGISFVVWTRSQLQAAASGSGEIVSMDEWTNGGK